METHNLKYNIQWYSLLPGKGRSEGIMESSEVTIGPDATRSTIVSLLAGSGLIPQCIGLQNIHLARQQLCDLGVEMNNDEN
jgi:hypothetical protein